MDILMVQFVFQGKCDRNFRFPLSNVETVMDVLIAVGTELLMEKPFLSMECFSKAWLFRAGLSLAFPPITPISTVAFALPLSPTHGSAQAIPFISNELQSQNYE